MQYSNSDLVRFVKDKINLKEEDLSGHRERMNRLRDNLTDYLKTNKDYGFIKMLNSGSVAKGTATSKLNDLDVAVYIRSDVANGYDESGLLEYIRDALVTIYKRYNMKEEQFSIGAHCIKVSYKSDELDIDVVPVVYEDGEDDRGYLINQDTGNRVLTSITLHKRFIQTRKNNHTNFKQMVRITKWWRDQQADFKMKSFLIEMIWAHIADTEGIKANIDDALSQFFRYIINTELSQPIIFTDNYQQSEVTIQDDVPNVFDPVNPENNVAVNLDAEKLERIIDEADKALSALSEAATAPTKGRCVDALKRVFGSSFSLD